MSSLLHSPVAQQALNGFSVEEGLIDVEGLAVVMD